VKLSREKLVYWRTQAADTLEHLSVLEGMQPRWA
jgi:hypothetical protein